MCTSTRACIVMILFYTTDNHCLSGDSPANNTTPVPTPLNSSCSMLGDNSVPLVAEGISSIVENSSLNPMTSDGNSSIEPDESPMNCVSSPTHQPAG